MRDWRAGVNQFEPRSIRYLVGAHSQEIGFKSQDVIAAPVCNEQSESQKNADA